MMLNWLLALCIFLVVMLFVKKIRSTCIISSVILFILGFIDALVIAFRGNQISINDIYSIRTALSVVGNYKLTLNPMFIFAIVIFCGDFMCLCKVRFKTEKIGKMRFAGIPLILIFTLLVVSNIQQYQVATWTNKGCTSNGVFLEWILEVRDLHINKPENYSDEYVEEMLSHYIDEEKAGKTPNIIVVMSEAYSDLTVLGDLETSEIVMPNFDKLCQ